MNAVKLLDKEINDYLVLLSVQQKQAVLNVVKTFAHEEESWWNNKSYMDEMNRRFAEMESGKEKGITLDELEAATRQSFKKKRLKK